MRLNDKGLAAARRLRGRVPASITRPAATIEAIITAYLKAAGFRLEKDKAGKRSRFVSKWENDEL